MIKQQLEVSQRRNEQLEQNMQEEQARYTCEPIILHLRAIMPINPEPAPYFGGLSHMSNLVPTMTRTLT